MTITGIDFLYESLGMLSCFAGVSIFLVALYYLFLRPLDFLQQNKQLKVENERLKSENECIKRDFDVVMSFSKVQVIPEEVEGDIKE